MPLAMHNLKPFSGAKKSKWRVGRGNSSGSGTYSGRGLKGQRARSGGRRGLQIMALKRMVQNIPKKRGFKSLYKRPAIVNIGALGKLGDIKEVTPAILQEKGFVREIKNGVKILGEGELKVALTISGCQVSKTAREKIEKAGGKVESELSV